MGKALSPNERLALAYIEGYHLASGELPPPDAIADLLKRQTRTTAARTRAIRDKLRRSGLLKPSKLKRKLRGGGQ